MCKVFLKTELGETLLGKTEVLKNNLNPDFQTSFNLDFIFEKHQNLRFEIWDHDTGVMDDNDLIGICTVGEIMGSKNQTLVRDLKRPKSNASQGSIIIKGDKSLESSYSVLWQWKANKIKNVDGWFGESDPFLKFFRWSGDWVFIHETEFVKNCDKPIWKLFELPMNKLDNGNRQQDFKVQCWDNQTNGKHQYIGETLINLDKIINQEQKQWNFQDAKGKVVGHLELQSFSVIQTPSFLDYLKGGEQINVMIAIDFTGSNGDPKSPNSLHFNNPNQLNQYQQALSQVCGILLNYDWDKKIPVYGFGGVPRLPNYQKNAVDHCFPLTGSFAEPEVAGIEGVMQYYQGALNQVQLSGPTYFGPVIEYAMQAAQNNVGKCIYTVLLIITDGEIHDMPKTQDLILNSAGLPLSIIIVGVGNEKFTEMRTLDGDDGPLKAKSRRDLVQFVSFRECVHQDLAQQVLAELPTQLVKYKQIVGQQPKIGI